MISSLNQINISVIQEFTRIKKPQKQALLIGKLFCVMLCTFRSPQLTPDFTFEMVQAEFDKWESIQYFIFSNPNRTLNETILIKQRASQKGMTHLEYAKKMIQLVAENEMFLKNIPNKNLKLIFDTIQRVLIYVEYKHMKKSRRSSPNKVINPNNNDLDMLDDDISQQIHTQSNKETNSNCRPTEQTVEADDSEDLQEDFLVQDEEDKSQISFQQCHQQEIYKKSSLYPDQTMPPLTKLNQFYPLSNNLTHSGVEVVRIDDLNDSEDQPLRASKDSRYIESFKSEIPSHGQTLSKERDQADIIDSSRVDSIQPTKNLCPSSSNCNKHQIPLIAFPDRKLDKLRSSYSPQAPYQKMKQIPQPGETRHRFNNASQYSSQISNQVQQKPEGEQIEGIQIKVDLNSEVQSSSRTEKKSFIDKKASEIIQEMMNIKEHFTTLNHTEGDEYQTQDIVRNSFQVQASQQTFEENKSKQSCHSQTHSRKGSIQILHQTTQQPTIEQEATIDLTQTPQFMQSQKSTSNLKSQSLVKTSSSKKKKELSPTQKLIKFKNKTHKSKISQQRSPKAQNAMNQLYSPVLENQKTALDDKKKALNTSQQMSQKIERKQSSPKSSVKTSQKTLEDINYQIQMPNKDIFSYDGGSVTQTEQTSSHGSTHQPKIQVYKQGDNQVVNIGHLITLNDDDDDGTFQLKLMKVQDFSYEQQQLNESKSRINMSTIEELKQRRLNQVRDNSQSLAEKRDDMIKKIQAEILNQMRS